MEKKKLQYDEWMKRNPSNPDLTYLIEELKNVDKGLENCEEILNKIDMSINFSSKINEIYRVVQETGNLIQYVGGLPSDIYNIIDNPLTKNFNLNATESISRIHVEDICSDDTMGVKSPLPQCSETTPDNSGIRETGVNKITFDDFMYEGKNGGKYIQKFEGLFKADYEYMSSIGELGDIKDYNGYVKYLMKQGEFDHKMNQPYKELISSVADFTIILPLIEMCTGTDLITHEDLTESERALKGIGAVVDIFTLDQAGIVSKLGTKLGLKAIAGVGEKELVNETLNKTLNSEMRERILKNIEESKIAREASNYKEFAEFEKEFEAGRKIDTISNGVSNAVESGSKIPVVKGKITGEDWCRYFREQYGAENVIWENATPAELAKSWQEIGKYIGVDDYKNIILQKGKIIYRGEPNGTEYFTTKLAIEKSGRNATTIFEGLQVEKNPIHGYRGNMQGYLVNENVEAAFGITRANPQFGKGGLPQMFVPDVKTLIDNEILIPVDNIPLIR